MAPDLANAPNVLHAELKNTAIWIFALMFIYLFFNDSPYLYSNQSDDPWLRAIALWPYDIRFLYIILTLIFNVIPFIAVCIYYDIINKFQWFESYHLTNKYPQPKELVSDTIMYDLKLMFIFAPIYTFFTFNADNNFNAIPNLWTIVTKLLCAIYAFDVGFYATHRMLHLPMFYKWHKLHHEYKTTIAWAATYSSYFELIAGNAPPTALPIVLFGLHPVTVLLFMMYRNIETTVCHSNYNLPFYVSPLFIFKHLPGHYEQERLHAFHHSNNDGCFGFYFVDALFGTNEKFKKHLTKEKNL